MADHQPPNSPKASQSLDLCDAGRMIQRDFTGTRVLLAEDEPINREVTEMLLADVGLVVDVVEDGLAAVRKAMENTYAIILLDVEMPQMDGLKAARQLRGHYELDQTPILALTANAFVEDERACHQAGMNGYLRKPVSARTLYEFALHWLQIGKRAATSCASKQASDSK